MIGKHTVLAVAVVGFAGQAGIARADEQSVKEIVPAPRYCDDIAKPNCNYTGAWVTYSNGSAAFCWVNIASPGKVNCVAVPASSTLKR